MSIHPQIGQGSLNTPVGVAGRIRDLERRVANLKATSGYVGVGSVSGDKLKPGTVTGNEIAAGTITADLISALAINAGHIQAGAITAGHIAANAITATNIAAGTITATHIATATITAVQIAADTITASNIAAGTITGAKIAAETITSTNIQAGTIQASDIAAGTITATQISAGSITGALIQAGTITATNIATGTLTGALLAGATITGSKLIADTITSREVVGTTLSGLFADLGTVVAGTLRIGVASGSKVAIGDSIATSSGTKSGIVATDSNNHITLWADPSTGNLQLKGQLLTGSTGLGTLAAGGGTIDGTNNIATSTIAGDRLMANTITAAKIASATITANEIASNTITGGKIAAGTITGTNIAAGTITADKITLALGGQNLLVDPSFETDAVGATPSGISTVNGSTVVSSDFAFHGDKSIKATSAGGVLIVYGGTSRWARVHPGQTYTQTVWTRPGSTARAISHQITYYDASLALISDHLGAETTQTAGQWRRSAPVTAVAPAGAAWARILLNILGTANGEVHYLDAWQFEQGDYPTSFSPFPAQGITSTEIRPGSIVTGSLSATAIDGMTITGATIRTDDAGARLELTTAGGLVKYAADGSTPVVLGPTDGLDLLSGTTTTPPSDRRLRWKRSDGTIAVDLTAFGNPGASGVEFNEVTYLTGTGTYGKSTHAVADSAGSHKATVVLGYSTTAQGADPANHGKVEVGAAGAAGSQSRTLLDSSGSSHYIQNAVLNETKLGVGSTGFNGGTTATVFHGLGAIPTQVFLQPKSNTSVNFWVSSASSNQMTISASSAFTGTVDWVAYYEE